MDNNELSIRFKKGLKANGITEEELHNEYYYIGGDFSYHVNYCQKNKLEIPENPTNRCLCGHKIRNNIFITNGDKILSLGSACYAKFSKKGKQPKQCKDCGIKHRNRKDNLCIRCRKKFTMTPLPSYIILSFK